MAERRFGQRGWREFDQNRKRILTELDKLIALLQDSIAKIVDQVDDSRSHIQKRTTQSRNAYDLGAMRRLRTAVTETSLSDTESHGK